MISLFCLCEYTVNWGMLGDLVLGMDVPFVSYFVVFCRIVAYLSVFFAY